MNGFLSADLLGVVVAHHLGQRHGSSVVSVGYAPKWDIHFASGLTIEVKFDKATAVTGNCCIEFWDLKKNKPSGILATEASTWIHCVLEGGSVHCYEIDTKWLLRLCIEAGQTKVGGDGNGVLMKLIPLQNLREISTDDYVLRGELIELVRQRVLQE